MLERVKVEQLAELFEQLAEPEYLLVEHVVTSQFETDLLK